PPRAAPARTPQGQQPPPPPPAPRALARLFSRSPLTLSAYHQVGEQRGRLEDDGQVPYLKGWRGQVARLLGKSESTLNKALQFRRTYEATELPELERLGGGWSRLTGALAVKDKQKRHRLPQRAEEGGGGNRALQRQR